MYCNCPRKKNTEFLNKSGLHCGLNSDFTPAKESDPKFERATDPKSTILIWVRFVMTRPEPFYKVGSRSGQTTVTVSVSK